MRSIIEIKEQITTAFMADDAVRKLYNLKGSESFPQLFPPVCVESVLLYVFAYGMWIIECLFNQHRTDVEDALANLKPHTLRWYTNKAKAFQIDDQLPADANGLTASDTYAVVDPTKQIVRYAVAEERDRVVVLKLAKYVSHNDHRPAKLTTWEIDAVRRYFLQIKDAGVPVAAISNAPDTMRLQITIFYNAMRLHPETKQGEVDLYGTTSKGLVRAAVEQVIENLPFNGACKKTDIEDAMRAIDGVDVVDITSMQIAAEDGEYTPVTGFCTPISGYFKLDQLTLTLKTYEYGSQV